MSERQRPEPDLDLAEVLLELGHTPESFARTVGRNASGLRRAIRGESIMTFHTALDIIEGLLSEGWQGDPRRLKQVGKLAPAVLEKRRQRSGAAPSESASHAAVRRALADLMQAVGREEVDRVYVSVFGTKPNERDS